MNKKGEKIHIIATGGTIDSHWDPTRDTVVPNKTSVIPGYLKNLNLFNKVIFSKMGLKSSVTQLFMKDSRDISTTDFKKLLEVIKKTTAKKILVTIGTYTMPDAARYIEQHFVNKSGKTIIFTGAFTPLEGFNQSDAPFNLGYAIAKLQEPAPGVYVCMNGRTFTPAEVAKSVSESKYFSVQKNKRIS